MTSTTVTTRTRPYEYVTNTNETDALGFNPTAELTGTEAVASASCELRQVYTREDVSATGMSVAATVLANVVTQRYDARGLAPGHYQWLWNITLNTGAIRSYETLLIVENHD
jgi:hypothetical protein